MNIDFEIKWQYTKYGEYDVYPVGWHLVASIYAIFFAFAFFFMRKCTINQPVVYT